MGYTSFISYLDLRRPLVFLCGPAYNENDPSDRRLILKRHINSKWTRGDDSKKDYISAFPIVVDNFFKPEDIRSDGLDIKINIIEEIISNIAYRTYIFLDTMSTSYELGQFTNFAYDSNKVSVFVDKQYKDRTNNTIGGYIKESLMNCFVEYTAAYDAKGHIFFPFRKEKKHRIPKEIIDVLNNDNPTSTGEPFLYQIVFSTNMNDVNNPGAIICKKEKNQLSFNFSIKNLFYFVSAVYRRIKENRTPSLSEMPKSIDDNSFKEFMTELNKELLTSYVCCSEAKHGRGFVLSPDFSISICVGNMSSEDLIYHMLYISYMLANYKGKQTYAVARYDSKYLSTGLSFPKSEIDFLDIKNNHIKKLIDKYNNRKNDNGVSCMKMRIKKKVRTITAYETNHSGKELRYLHGEILKSLLSVLPSSKSSFAYKDGLNTKACIECHEGNTFFAKYDVNKYFESITMSFVKNKICEYIVSQFSMRFNKIAYYNKLKSSIERDVLDMIRPLFYKYKLPIGYVTSPKISDFYLYKLDEEMGGVDGVTYTRYADDILLSSNDKNILNVASEKLVCLLKKENLTINEKKTRFGSLINVGDSFRFLGINLVRRKNEQFELTISNRYIVETSKLFCSYVESPNDKNKLEEITGRINYIKSISQKSFSKLKHLISIKLEEKNLGIPVLVGCLLRN